LEQASIQQAAEFLSGLNWKPGCTWDWHRYISVLVLYAIGLLSLYGAMAVVLML